MTNHNQKQNNAPNTTKNKTMHQTWPKTKHCTKHDLHPTQWTKQSCHWRCTNSMLLFTASHSYHKIQFFRDVTMCCMASSSQCFQGSQLLHFWGTTILWNVTLLAQFHRANTAENLHLHQQRRWQQHSWTSNVTVQIYLVIRLRIKKCSVEHTKAKSPLH